MLLNKIITKLSMKDNNTCNSLNIFLLQNLGKIPHVKIYKQNIIDNEFIDEDEIKIIEKYYIESKKHYDSFKKLLHLWKYKKFVEYDYKNDLYLTPLSEFKEIHKIVLVENKTKYFFRLSDLVNSWITCLKNSEGLFPKPLELKNPHTNLVFSTHNLYNIYFKLLETKFNIPYLINCFFNCEMHLTLFTLKYLTILKEITILNFARSDNYIEKWEQILNMLHKYRKNIDYVTFSNFVELQDKLVITKKLNYILLHYLKSEFSCNPLIKDDSNIRAKELLEKYIEENPYFGFDLDHDNIIRYVPYNERRNRSSMPPPPPPGILENIRRRRNRANSPPPPPPPEGELPPPILANVLPSNTIINTDDIVNRRRRRYRNRSRTIRFPRLNPLFSQRLTDVNENEPDFSSSEENTTETVTVINPFEINFDIPIDADSTSEENETSEVSELEPLLNNEEETPTQEVPQNQETRAEQINNIENQLNTIENTLENLGNELIRNNTLNRSNSYLHRRSRFTLLSSNRITRSPNRNRNRNRNTNRNVNLTAIVNPFIPRNELPRSPSNH